MSKLRRNAQNRPVSTRRKLLALHPNQRRPLLEVQAQQMVAYYAEDHDRREWQGGEFFEYQSPEPKTR